MPIGLHIMEVEERIRVTGEGEQVSKGKWKKCRIENTTSCMKTGAIYHLTRNKDSLDLARLVVAF